MIPKIWKFNQMRILKNPFHHFDTFLLILTATLNWWSPWPSSQPREDSQESSQEQRSPHLTISNAHKSKKWGSTRILFTISTCFHLFQCSPYVMIPKVPMFKSVRILKDPFHNFDTFSTFMSTVFIWWCQYKEPQVQCNEDPQASFSPLWHFFNIFECSSHLMIPKAPRWTQWQSWRMLFTILTVFHNFSE
jgi:hypothetical protein